MNKIDLKKSLDSYKARHHEFRIFEVPMMQYLMMDGHGDPNTSQEFSDAVRTLFAVAYKLKFASKLDLGKDYTVMPLEGLWWSEDMSTFTTARDKSKWDFTLMIMQPDWITRDMFHVAVAKAVQKDPTLRLHGLRFENLAEGLVVQTLHIGSFDDETAILEHMHSSFIPEHALRIAGKHHEIYMSDFRKVVPEKLKTILRQPVVRRG